MVQDYILTESYYDTSQRESFKRIVTRASMVKFHLQILKYNNYKFSSELVIIEYNYVQGFRNFFVKIIMRLRMLLFSS